MCASWSLPLPQFRLQNPFVLQHCHLYSNRSGPASLFSNLCSGLWDLRPAGLLPVEFHLGSQTGCFLLDIPLPGTYRLIYLSPNCVKLFAAITFASDLSPLYPIAETCCRVNLFVLICFNTCCNLPWLAFLLLHCHIPTVFCASLNGDQSCGRALTKEDPWNPVSFVLFPALPNQEIC